MRFSLLSPQRGLRVLALIAPLVAGCTAGTRDDAARGAKVGAVGGLVAGAVGSIFWGGDAVNNALRSAAVGAASGAAVGAVSSSGRDASEHQRRRFNPRPTRRSSDSLSSRGMAQMDTFQSAPDPKVER